MPSRLALIACALGLVAGVLLLSGALPGHGTADGVRATSGSPQLLRAGRAVPRRMRALEVDRGNVRSALAFMRERSIHPLNALLVDPRGISRSALQALVEAARTDKLALVRLLPRTARGQSLPTACPSTPPALAEVPCAVSGPALPASLLLTVGSALPLVARAEPSELRGIQTPCARQVIALIDLMPPAAAPPTVDWRAATLLATQSGLGLAVRPKGAFAARLTSYLSVISHLTAGLVRSAPTAAAGSSPTKPSSRGPGTANVFVAPDGNDGGGLCKRFSKPVAAPADWSSACARFARAYALARPGDTIMVESGTFPSQDIQFDPTKDRASSNVLFTPPPGGIATLSGTLVFEAAHITIERFRFVGDDHSISDGRPAMVFEGDGCHTHDITIQNSTALNVAAFLVINGSSNITFDHDDFGQYSTPGQEDAAIGSAPDRTCNGAPAPPSRNIVIRNSSFHDVFWDLPTANWGGSHPDCLEIDDNVDGVTIENSRFYNCANSWMMVGPTSVGDVLNLTIQDNVFWNIGSDTYYGIQVTNAGKEFACGNTVIRDNVFDGSNAKAGYGYIRTDCTADSGYQPTTVYDNVFGLSPSKYDCARFTASPYDSDWQHNVYLATNSGHRLCGSSGVQWKQPIDSALSAATTCYAGGTAPATTRASRR